VAKFFDEVEAVEVVEHGLHLAGIRPVGFSLAVAVDVFPFVGGEVGVGVTVFVFGDLGVEPFAPVIEELIAVEFFGSLEGEDFSRKASLCSCSTARKRLMSFISAERRSFIFGPSRYLSLASCARASSIFGLVLLSSLRIKSSNFDVAAWRLK